MAVTNEYSSQVTNINASPPVKMLPFELEGRHRIARFSFTQGAAAGDAGSTADLCILPPGATIIKSLSKVVCSAFGASRTLDIGHLGYTQVDYAETVVAAAADVLLDAGDVSALAELQMGVGTNALTADNCIVTNSRGPVTVQGVVAGGTIPVGATITGYITYVVD